MGDSLSLGRASHRHVVADPGISRFGGWVGVFFFFFFFGGGGGGSSYTIYSPRDEALLTTRQRLKCLKVVS